MFRSLATRLTATYVFAAILLVVIVVAAVTAFSLTMFGISARETSEDVAREIPDEVRLQLGHNTSLEAAAPAIVRNLSRPGVHIAIFGKVSGGLQRFLAGNDQEGLVVIGALRGRPRGAAAPHGARSPDAGPPAGGPFVGAPPGGGPPADGLHDSATRMRAFPFGLNVFLRLQPIGVSVRGGRVLVMPDPSPLLRAINDFWVAMLPIGVFVVIAAWLLGRYITDQALRPLVETTASLRRFGAGDFSPRPVLTADRNEIGELANAYNAAAAQVSAAFEERRAAEQQMRQFVADAGHELRTPLTVIMGFIDVLRKRAASEPGISLKIFDTMIEESRRMKALIDKLIVLARLENAPTRELETVDLAQVAGDVVSALQALRRQPRIGLRIEASALVRGSETELHDALSNLVENALKYGGDSPVSVHVYLRDGEGAIEVADRGPGIPPDEQVQVFDRFYRGRDRNGETDGFGLGLAIAKRAVERAGGRIDLRSAPGEGTRFTMVLPLATRGEEASLAV